MDSSFQSEASEKLETGREMAAEWLDEGAEKIRSEGGHGRFRDATHKAARGLSSAADYLRSHSFSAISDDITNFLRRHPAEAVGVALAVGILAGRAMRRE